ncbi:MAG: hypothetical protein ABSD80_11280 [Caulobacteraceae bacterium]
MTDRAATVAPTLYRNFTKIGARLVLALVAALFLLGLPAGGGKPPASYGSKGPGDKDLYRAVIHRVHLGEPYPQAAVEEHRARGYPLRPFVVVRPPLLAVMISWAPNLIVPFVIEILLVLATVWAWAVRLRSSMSRPQSVAWAAVLVFTGAAAGLSGLGATTLHEVWAGLLIALSLALRTERRFAAAVALGFLAALIRELAMPYLAVMVGFAVIERRWREAAAFAAALAASGLALWFHAQAINALVTSHDLASPGWVRFGGWEFVLQASFWNAIGAALGPWARALLVPVALVGAYAWPDRRLVTLLAGYIAAFMVVGRSENFYWGLLIAPLIGVSLALAPGAFGDLFVTARLPVWRRRAA